MDDYDVYHLWLGIPPEEQPPHHYRLLGLRLFEENVEVIRNAADRQRTHVKRLGINQFQEIGQNLLNEIEVAKICLLRPEKRAAYDADLQKKLEQLEKSHGSSVEEQLNEETLIIGSDRNCDIVINRPTISGIHCSVMRRKDRVILRDLKSTNGTYVNLTRVLFPVRITPADLIVLGRDSRVKLPLSFFPVAQRDVCVGFVGRSKQCEISLNDQSVSGFHARVLCEKSAIQVEDLGSTNGTTLIDNQGKTHRLKPQTPTAVNGFREVVFGKHKISVEKLVPLG